MGLTASDLVQLRGTLSAFLPDTVALYDSAGVTLQWQGQVWLTNTKSLGSKRDYLDFTLLTAAQGTPIASAQVARHAPSGTLSPSDVWYLVAKTQVDVSSSTREQGMLFKLPYILVGEREAVTDPTTLNVYDEPAAVDGQGYPIVPTTALSIRAGFGAAFWPENETALGPLPQGTIMAYCPLGSDIKLYDQFTLPDGRVVRVDRLQQMQTDGQFYAWQILFNETVGSGDR